MRLATTLAAASLLLSATAAAEERPEAEPEEELLLVTGEQRVLEIDDVASFSESTRGVIEVKIPREGRRMVITAIRPGRTSLLLIRRGGSQRAIPITVLLERPERIERDVRELLDGEGGVQIRRSGARVYLDGVVSEEGVRERIERMAALYPGQVFSLVRVDGARVRPRTNVRFDLTFVELRSSSSWGAGVSWPERLGGAQRLDVNVDFTGGSGVGASYAIVEQALPALEAAARSGWARIRKRATLITTSGNRASYSAGGEVNVAVAGSQAAELRTVPYGCTLAVLPRLDAGPGILDVDVEAEVSDLTETSQAVPGRTLSKVQTLVHLGLGQSIVLSGLDAQSETASRAGLPGLSRIPILGFFFGTSGKRHERVEGLIAITPTILENLDREGRRRLEQVLERFEKFKGKFE
jgi:Flp pilus assembly secretin CpaC